MRIAPEGWPFIAIAWVLVVAAAFVANRGGGLVWVLPGVLAVLAIWVVAFFRDPIRPGARGDRYVLAAAEGHVVHVTEIDPGLVETEFSVVRFDGDRERAAKVYEGMTPLTAEDIADCVAWCVTRPKHVNIDEMVVRPLAQARATIVARDAGL